MKAARVLGWAVLGQLLFLAASGTLLFFEYRPSGAEAVPDGSSTIQSQADRVRVLHRLDARLVVPTALALVIVLASRRRHGRGALGASTILAGCLLASITGFLLPWDQLAVWAVTVGTNLAGYDDLTGYEFLSGEDVRFVLIGGTEISTTTISRWLLVHVGVGLLVLAGAGGRLIRWRRARPPIEHPG